MESLFAQELALDPFAMNELMGRITDPPCGESMKYAARQCFLLPLVLLCQVSSAHAADATLVVDEPAINSQPNTYDLQVLDDGFAQLHLKWAGPDEVGKHHVDLRLSKFEAKFDGSSDLATVGIDRGDPQSLFPYLKDVEVAAKGVVIRLAGSALTSDKEYHGTLYATVDNRQTLAWNVTLSRPGPVEPFRCPKGPQIVNPDGTTSIEFQRTAPLRENTVGLRLSPFISKDQHELGDVGFGGDPPRRELERQLPSYPIGERLIPPIRTLGLAEGATYSGKVSFIIGTRDVMECMLDLQMPKLAKAELVSDSSSLLRSVTLPIFGFCGDYPPPWVERQLRRWHVIKTFRFCGGAHPYLETRLFEKTRSRRIDGLAAALDGATESPGGSFGLAQHVDFLLDGTEVKKFTQWPDPEAQAIRTLRPGDQLHLTMAFHDLGAGKYAFPLRISGLNTAATPKIDVTVNVRHHWLWAVFAVAVALFFSWWISTGIVNWRERNRIRRRVQEMREENFDEHAHLPSVVFLHAVLARAERATAHKWFLPPPPSVNDYLARADRVVSIMSRYRELYEKLEDAACPETVKLHYREEIAKAMRRIGPHPLDQKTADGVLADLDVIIARLNDPNVWYWSHLKSEAALLLRQAKDVQAKLGQVEAKPGESRVSGLLKTLAEPPADPTAEPDRARAFDRAFWFVKLLYSRRGFPNENDKLLQAFAARETLEDAFECGDEFAWKRLKEAHNAIEITVAETTETMDRQVEVVRNVASIKKVAGPHGEPDEGAASGETLDSLRPTTFVLKFDDRSLEGSYLVANLLEYEWEFEFTKKTPRLRAELLRLFPGLARTIGAPQPLSWSKILNGTRAAYYAPAAGALTVKATIRFPAGGNRTAQSIGPFRKTVIVDENPEVKLFRNLNRPDLWLTVGAGAVALATSLPTYYFGKATFGSAADYIAILAWAIGIDQGKNLIQLLKTYQTDRAQAGSSA